MGCGIFRKYLTSNLLNWGFNVWVFLVFQKNLADYDAFMKLVKLQSWLKCVQSWNVNNTHISEMQFWNSNVLKHSPNVWPHGKGGKNSKLVEWMEKDLCICLFFPPKTFFLLWLCCHLKKKKKVKFLFCFLFLINKALHRPDFLTKSELFYLSSSAVGLWAYLLRISPFLWGQAWQSREPLFPPHLGVFFPFSKSLLCSSAFLIC